MKRVLVALCLIFSLCVLGFSDNLLGLRTVEATTTEAATEKTETGKLSLKTIDPLRASFQAGWKAPSLPGWKEAVVGGYTLKLPAGFSLNASKSGSNFDAEIVDSSGQLFARLFVYQLDAYKLDELLVDLTTSLYGVRTSGSKSFEEYSDLQNGRTAYLTKLTLSDQLFALPVLLLYQKGAQQTDVKSGTVVMLIVEPGLYQAPEKQDLLAAWIEGIGGSLIGSYAPASSAKTTEPVTIPVKETPKTTGLPAGKDFGALLIQRLSAEEWLDSPKRGWKTAYGDSFYVFYPAELKPDYFYADQLEGFDFVSTDMTVAKLFVGYIDEELLCDELYQDLLSSYLGGLGNYNLIKKTPYLDLQLGFVKTYELSFSDMRAWIMLFSESIIEDVFQGEYIVFIGIAPTRETETWKDIYLDMIMSVSFLN
ncbi:MAG TPA: hypothetical protein PLU70_01475 [Thermotogota bacterium]|jgi:hypothetical protein|nr:hypothetical protein [Thermotogota bacterium]NLH18575.1 hypothetical protein [Thermotogaceae bacterium]OQC32473.1 MAG: hypothetical protein BWX67_00351 [Thermotogota bacterium ADurb.Bin062]HNW45812.1 hypothetical protein [Thermotogota bacterium]HOD90557.1 hypothetical protein [Thermotogota bacterium]